MQLRRSFSFAAHSAYLVSSTAQALGLCIDADVDAGPLAPAAGQRNAVVVGGSTRRFWHRLNVSPSATPCLMNRRPIARECHPFNYLARACPVEFVLATPGAGRR